jgi:hypothetical protein
VKKSLHTPPKTIVPEELKPFLRDLARMLAESYLRLQEKKERQ